MEGAMASAPLRILADRVAPMHWLLIEEAIRNCENAEVVARDVPPAELEAAIRAHEPDVVILGAPEPLDRPELFEDWINAARPRRKLITLVDGPSLIQLREWRLTVDVLEDVSLNSLCAAIEGGR
jgi:AmiR/NasT family two-component response regulator